MSVYFVEAAALSRVSAFINCSNLVGEIRSTGIRLSYQTDTAAKNQKTAVVCFQS